MRRRYPGLPGNRLEKPGQLAGGFVLRDRIEFLEGRGEGVRQAPHRSGLEFLNRRVRISRPESLFDPNQLLVYWQDPSNGKSANVLSRLPREHDEGAFIHEDCGELWLRPAAMSRVHFQKLMALVDPPPGIQAPPQERLACHPRGPVQVAAAADEGYNNH
jgi:hypothetical protein